MRVLRHITLVFRRGASEKVYEIDLCEVATDQYVVNYRYGRRGGTFKEGSKTVSPVPMAEAEQVFERLEQTQLEKGYVPEGGGGAGGSTTSTSGPVGGPRGGLGARVAGRSDPPPRSGPIRVGPGSTRSSDPGSSSGPTRSGPAPVGGPGQGTGHGTSGGPSGGPGRRRVGPGGPASGPSAPSSAPGGPRRTRRPMVDPRADHILDRLNGVTGPDEERSHIPSRLREVFRPRRERRRRRQYVWPLERVIWRAGELRLTEAVPALIGLLGSGDARRDYCIIWALTRIGDRSALAAVNRIFVDPVTPPMVARVAAEAVSTFAEGEGLDRHRGFLARRLPAGLASLAIEGDAEAIGTALQTAFEEDQRKAWKAVERLYQVNLPACVEVVRSVLQQCPMTPPAFRVVRHIFKLAELRLDAETFGLIAWRFARTRANFTASKYGRWIRTANGDSIRLDRTRLGDENARTSYGSATRTYLRRRVWRTLRRLGELGDEAFVSMAVGVLLPFTDQDARSESSGWAQGGRVEFDGFGSYWAFNHLLLLRSHSKVIVPHKLRWGTRRGRFDRPGMRTEAFPELWDAQPAGLLHLLDGSGCERVHQFAVQALRDNATALQRLTEAPVAMLLSRPYEVTAALGLDLARRLFDPARPDARLILAAADAAHEPARQQARAWIDAAQSTLARDPRLLAGLITAQYADTREYARRLIRGLSLDEGTGQALTARLVAALMGLGKGEDAVAADLGDVLIRLFAQHLRTLGEPVILDLLRHRLEAVQMVGGDVVLRHATLAAQPSEAVLVGLLDSKFPAVRALGVRLLEGLSEVELKARASVVVALCTHSQADLREGGAALVGRLARDAEFGRKAAEGLIRTLVQGKLPDGVGPFVVHVLRAHLKDHLPGLPVEAIWRLLKKKAAEAQELGGLLLETQIKPEDLSLDQIARLANHEILSVREAAWSFYRRSVPRLKTDMATAVRVFDTDWVDSRQFAFEFFGQGQAALSDLIEGTENENSVAGSAEARFTAEDFSPEVLVGICDSVRPDVQRYGRALIQQYFTEADGVTYMLRLAEHPTRGMQLFVSQYLERYAAGHPDRIESMAPYFTGVLSRVNAGGVAKSRIFSFLEAEALKSETAAQVIGRYMARQSATIAIEDRARCVSIMVAIAQRWPAVETPLQRVSVEAR